MRSPRVAVVGGGVAGLACACTLARAAARHGHALSLTVLEAGDEAGGHARTAHAGGFVIERGPNGFLSREPETLALVDELGLSSRLVEASAAAKRRFIAREGRLRRVPDSPLTLVSSDVLSWRGKLRLLGEPWASPAATIDESVHAFAARRLGLEAAEMLVDPAIAGISGGDSRELSVGAQFPTLAAMEREHGGLVRGMWAKRKQPKPAGRSRLLSFDRGVGVLTQAMAETLGAALRLTAPVRALERRGGEWRLQLAPGEAAAADHVVLAAPARCVAPIVHDLDAPLSEALAAIPYASLAVVALGFAADLAHPLDGYGYLVTRGAGLATLGVLWESSIFPGRAPAGGALLRVFLGGRRRPEVAAEPAAALVERARHEVAAVMGVTATPDVTQVMVWPDAIAQYTLGHLARRARIADLVGRHPGLHVCGTSYDGVAFNQAIVSGRAAARAVAAHAFTAAGDVPAGPDTLAAVGATR